MYSTNNGPSNCYEENTSDIIDIRENKYIITRCVTVVLFSLLLLCGIISNILMAMVAYNVGNQYGRAFVLITYQIIAAQLLSLISFMVVVIPELLLNEEYGRFLHLIICTKL